MASLDRLPSSMYVEADVENLDLDQLINLTKEVLVPRMSPDSMPSRKKLLTVLKAHSV